MHRSSLAGTCLVLALLLLGAAPASAWVWDADADGIDDHIEAVVDQGIAAAYENGDVNARLMIHVTVDGGVPTFGVFVRYDHQPTPADEQALQAIVGLSTHRYRYIPYVLARATWSEIQQISALPGVDRIENEPMMYAINDNIVKHAQVTGGNGSRFPSAAGDAGITGRGVVVAILDSGVNDAPHAGGYPGHESLIGKFLGGGQFSNVDPLLNTPINGSENPVDGSPDFSHGSHVAGTAIGTGGPSGVVADGNYGFYRGVAPDARLVDCKVLSDAGVGPGGSTAAGLEWIIFHKDDDWGLVGEDAIFRGVQVANLSLGGLLEDSDGTDASSAAVNAAVRAGIVCCVATGNDGNTGFISSPAAADLAIACGANVDFNTQDRADDIVADFSNEGPRRDDGDADHLDEMRPSVCATGGGVTSVEGVLTANGSTYVTTNGTSMSTPATAGLCALILQACPGISPAEVQRILQDTADHRTTGGKQGPGAVDPFGLDPNYHPSWGWGNPNAYAAVLEALYPNRTQVVREWADVVSGGLDVRWTTQREVDVTGFRVLRADPVYGRPGPFVPVSPAVTPTGDPFIHADGNRTDYVYEDRDPALVPGETYWYRIRWTDVGGADHDEPAFPVIYDPPVALATVQWSITHNTPDNDLLVYLGSGTDVSDPVNTAAWLIPLPGTGAADSSVAVPGEATTGNVRHYWTHTLTGDDPGVASFLPPSADNPWFLYVAEGGFVNRLGRVEDFRITTHGGGDVLHTPLVNGPVPTVQDETVVLWIPSDPALALNHAPVIEPVGDRELQEGKTLAFTVTATDPDGETPTLSASALPPGATFDPAVGAFAWSPGYDEVAGTTSYTATFEASDGLGAGDTESIAIRLHDVDPASNLPPFFPGLEDRSVIAGNPLSFTVAGDDPECDSLTLAGVSLPAGATFDPGTGTFAWTPGDSLDGDFLAGFSVSDGVNSPVVDEMVIRVKGAIPPLLEPCDTSTETYSGTSGIGSADLGNADVDTVLVPLPGGASRLFATLSWVGAADLDVTLEDGAGNVIGSGASLGNPETVLVDNLAPGTYRFIVVGFLVPLDTDWVLALEICTRSALAIPITLSHFQAEPREGVVRLEWATSRESRYAGFRVYRASQEDGEYAPLVRDLVSGDGVYLFEDGDVASVEGAEAWYRLGAVDFAGAELPVGPWRVDLAATRTIPFRLAQNAPNPFAAGTGRTVIRFSLPRTGEARLDVYDVRGRHVRTLAEGRFERGESEVAWDGTDASGSRVASGVYFYRLVAPGQQVDTRRLVVLR